MTNWDFVIGSAGQDPWYDLWTSGWNGVKELDSEISAGRGSYDTLLIRFTDIIHYSVGLAQNLDGNGKRGVDFADPVNLQDLATKSFVAAYVQTGGSPGDIPVKKLKNARTTLYFYGQS